MGINKPYKRNRREFSNDVLHPGAQYEYIFHPDFSKNPKHFIRAYLIIQKDFINLLDFIEPADKNLSTYSFRIHELLLRVCIEIEANFVAILLENGYIKGDNWSMNDYKKINITHHLSSYRIKYPTWFGEKDIRQPFEGWDYQKGLKWWQAYNLTKHNRHNEFENATFENLTEALAGLIALLSSQFENNDFSFGDILISAGEMIDDGMSYTIGDYFRVKYPDDWKDEEKYNFSWNEIKNDENPIQNYDYNS